MSQQRASSPRLSVSMIVKNEEKFLAECLQSVHAIADEIVVVDTGSTDGTKEIAQRFGARVFDFEWTWDFAAARNFSLHQCCGEWVLYIDADERLAPESARLLPKLISDPKADAYLVTIDNPQSMHRGRVHQQNSYPRLFRRASGIRFEGRVHEQIAPSLLRLKKRVLPSLLCIHHLGYDRGYDIVRQKAERNLELLQRQLEENPNDAYAAFQLGNSLVVLQQYAEARPVLQHAVAHPDLDKSNRAACYNLLAEVAVRSRNFEEAIDCCRKSLELVPKQMMARWFLSLLYYDVHEYDRALDVLKDLLRIISQPAVPRTSRIASDIHLERSDIFKRLALTYEASSQILKAVEFYLYVLEHTSDAGDAVQGIIRCSEKCSDSRSIVEKLTQALQRFPQRTEFYVPLAIHHRKLQNVEASLACLDRALTAQPLNADLYALAIRWNMESGHAETALRWCQIAEEKKLSSFELHKSALLIYLAHNDIHATFRQLELMAQTTDADLTPVRKRLTALANKLSASSPAL